MFCFQRRPFYAFGVLFHAWLPLRVCPRSPLALGRQARVHLGSLAVRGSLRSTESTEEASHASQASPSSTTSAAISQSTLRSTKLSSRVLLQGKNLILIGDSNDRQFFTILCHRLTGRMDRVHVVDKVNCSSGEYQGQVTWPEGSKTLICHDEAHDSSVMFLFHYGLFSLPPQPTWYVDFAKRRMGSHFLGVRGKSRMVSSTDLASYIWPEVIARLPKRPAILLVQSSMWDAFAVLEGLTGKRVSQMTDADIEKQHVSFSEANLSEWRWMQRASDLRSVEHAQENVALLLWRTNPNCPFKAVEGSVVAYTLSELFAKVVRKEIQEGWRDVCLVDWRNQLEITSPKQCDKHHYTKEGYNAYLDALCRCISIPEKPSYTMLHYVTLCYSRSRFGLSMAPCCG